MSQTITKIGHFIFSGIIHFLHRLMMPLMVLVIIYAALVSSFVALTPWAKMYQPRIIAYLNQTIGHRVQVQDIETSWYGLYPVLKLKQLKVIPADHSPPLMFDECWIGFDVLRSLLYWHIHPGMLYIDGLRLNLVQERQQWSILQTKFLQASLTPEEASEDAKLKWVSGVLSFMPEKVILKNIRLHVQPQFAVPFDFHQVRFLAQKREGHYHWSIEAKLANQQVVRLRVNMPLLSNLQFPQKGRLFFETDKLSLKALPWYRELCDFLKVKNLSGMAHVNAWLDWDDHGISMVHSQFSFDNLGFYWPLSGKMIQLAKIEANSLWKKTASGWELALDGLNLNYHGRVIIDDKILIYHLNEKDVYHLYLEQMPLVLLKQLNQVVPKVYQIPFNWYAKGRLHELQINIQEQKLDYVLTQFEELSWPNQANYPGVSGLNGVVSWEPRNTHLEISSQAIKVFPAHLPPIQFDKLHAVIDSHRQDDVTEWAIERLVLTRPDFAMTVHGEVDEPTQPHQANVRLQGTWAMEHVEQWQKYLPAILPPSGLRQWLQHDIKKITKSSGEWVINGPWEEFPFDHRNGELTVNGFLYGTDLKFAPGWPVAKNIDGRLVVHGRELEAHIDKGQLGPKLPIAGLRLRAPDMGLNKELLLVHGQLAAPANQMVSYLIDTPLKDKAKGWQMMQMDGQAHLDLRLDIPLYKERDDVYVSGQVEFDEQTLDLHLFTNPLRISNVQGHLIFNEDGVTGGAFTGHIGTDHLVMNVVHQKDTHQTSFKFRGGIGVAELKKAWNLQNIPYVTGHLPVDGDIQLPSGNQNDWHMVWKSALNGVSLDLPSPWGKAKNSIQPMEVDMTYTADDWLKMNFKYVKESWDLDLKDKRWHFFTEQPNWAGDLYYTPQQDLIEGKLQRVWIDPTQVKTDTYANQPPWEVKDMPNLNVQVDDFRWDNMVLGQLVVQAKNQKTHWDLEQLKLTSPNYDLLIHGQYTQHQLRRFQTDFSGQLMITRLSKTLETLRITPVADAKGGSIDFEGHWHDSLNQSTLKNLDGEVEVSLKKGNITHLDRQTEQKIGLGKLLSILSLQTLPRRLQLDFSDLATTGFTYDIFKGHFVLHDGLLHTENSELDGPVANVKMQGDLNVVDRWYDLQLQVFPYITASLPVVATIAGGPIAGVATWAASSVLNQGMQKISAYTYKITGPWQEPVVQQVGIERKK
jgi:uncharacterized protein YhdP